MSLRGWPAIRACLAATSVAVLIVVLSRGVDTIYGEPVLWVPVVSLNALIFTPARLPMPLICFWLFGLFSLFWSLGPGNTLVAFLWEGLYIAAFAIGLVPTVAATVLGLTVLYGYFDVTALSTYGLQSYVSGSIGYVAGATGASASILAFAFAGRSQSKLLNSAAAVLLSALGLTVALSSGSRAVYLALVTGAILTIAVLLWKRHRHRLRTYGVAAVSVLVLALGFEMASGYQVVMPALQTRGTVATTTETVGNYGVLTQRLRLWYQGVIAAFEYPLGTGAGTYAATAHAFQRYPMLWSSSPHNYLIQVLATGGWIRLALLLLLVGTCLRVGFRDGAWPWTIAGIVIGMTTLFDVTGGYPRVMGLAFMLFGTGYYQGLNATRLRAPENSRLSISPSRPIFLTGAVALAGAIAWWYFPCNDKACSVDRYLGMDTKTVHVLSEIDSLKREQIITRLHDLYPRSLWVSQLDVVYADDAQDRLQALSRLTLDYPLQHPNNYLRWAEAALAVDDVAQARKALEVGLSYFPREKYPYGEMRITPAGYEAWADEAEELLRSLTPD